MTDIADVIAFAESYRNDRRKLDWWKEARQRAAALSSRSSGCLSCFSTHQFADLATEARRVTPDFGATVPPSLQILASRCWSTIADGDLERAQSVISVARVEFTRSLFHALLVAYATADDREHSTLDPSPEALRRELTRRDWSDADAVSADPVVAWASESAGEGFADWCSEVIVLAEESMRPRFSERAPTVDLDPFPTEDQLYAALALSWTDRAVVDPSRAVEFLSEAAALMGAVGFEHGLQCSDYLRAEALSDTGTRLADARHARNREMRARAIEYFQAHSHLTKDRVAEQLAGHVLPVTFRTVRNWLRGVPAAPQAASGASQSGAPAK